METKTFASAIKLTELLVPGYLSGCAISVPEAAVHQPGFPLGMTSPVIMSISRHQGHAP